MAIQAGDWKFRIEADVATFGAVEELAIDQLPRLGIRRGESLADTAARVIPYYENKIAPMLREGKGVLVVAHGNSLRALMMRLENLTPSQILEVELPTGIPKRYVMDASGKIRSSEFL